MLPRFCKRCGAKTERVQGHYCESCYRPVEALRVTVLNRVRAAINRGDLPHPKDCICADCGVQAFDYDHRDYTKPLEVTPVCRKCNQARGPAIQLQPIRKADLAIKQPHRERAA